MHKADKWRRMRRMGGWPFVAAMMADADCRDGYGASTKFGGPGWTFDFGQRGGGRRRRRMFGSGELRLVLLKLLAESGQPAAATAAPPLTADGSTADAGVYL